MRERAAHTHTHTQASAHEQHPWHRLLLGPRNIFHRRLAGCAVGVLRSPHNSRSPPPPDADHYTRGRTRIIVQHA